MDDKAKLSAAQNAFDQALKMEAAAKKKKRDFVDKISPAKATPADVHEVDRLNGLIAAAVKVVSQTAQALAAAKKQFAATRSGPPARGTPSPRTPAENTAEMIRQANSPASTRVGFGPGKRYTLDR